MNDGTMDVQINNDGDITGKIMGIQRDCVLIFNGRSTTIQYFWVCQKIQIPPTTAIVESERILSSCGIHMEHMDKAGVRQTCAQCRALQQHMSQNDVLPHSIVSHG